VPAEGASYEELLAFEQAQGGSVSSGLQPADIDSLPQRRVVEADRRSDDDSCPICCDAFECGERLTSLPCAHHFHSMCVNRWLAEKGTCPVCMRDVREDLRASRV